MGKTKYVSIKTSDIIKESKIIVTANRLDDKGTEFTFSKHGTTFKAYYYKFKIIDVLKKECKTEKIRKDGIIKVVQGDIEIKYKQIKNAETGYKIGFLIKRCEEGYNLLGKKIINKEDKIRKRLILAINFYEKNKYIPEEPCFLPMYYGSCYEIERKKEIEILIKESLI